MIALLVTLILIAVPIGHQAIWHNGLRKVLRAVAGNGPELPPTEHEIKHARRGRRARVLIEIGWACYLAGAILIGMAFR
jgi:hypothetical protein